MGETCKILSNIAKELSIYLIGGTIPEKEENGEKCFNTCTIWNPDGSLQAVYRKMHLFDIDIPGEITFKESDSLSAGNESKIVEFFGHKIGIGICYDIRFEELAKLYRKKGCDMLIYPGAFNMKTGPLHWELLARGRANDNQLYVATISPARDTKASYVAWGHSLIVDPWGQVMQEAMADEEVIIGDIDFTVNEKVRKQIPVFSQRRSDIYDTVEK
jgi:predicted amidohydrolase